MTNPNMNAGFAGQMLNVRQAVADMSTALDRLTTAKNTAVDNERRLSSLLECIDKKQIKQVELTFIVNGGSVSATLYPNQNAIAIETINSLVVEVLGDRTANAMNKVRELAAQLSADQVTS